jgi:DNA-binding MurR/RpiR family transcriptional regulator
MGVPAATYDDLQAEIGRRFPSLSPQLQQIARYALERPQDVALDTVAAAANKAQVQPSAMVRFAQALGYDGYSDMQRIFRDRLLQRSASYRDRIATLRRAHPRVGESPEGGAARFRERFHRPPLPPRGAHRSGAARGRREAPRASRARARARPAPRVPVACYLSYALAQLELAVTLLDGVGGMLEEQAAGLVRGDVLLAVSFRNYSPSVIELPRNAFARGISVIVITIAP